MNLSSSDPEESAEEPSDLSEVVEVDGGVPGQAPGLVNPVLGEGRGRVRLCQFDLEGITDSEILPDSLVENDAKPNALWFDFTGEIDVQKLSEFLGSKGVHPLHLEDATNTSHPGQIQDEGEYVLFTLPVLRDGDPLVRRQLSILLLPNRIVTFHDGVDFLLDPVRQRLEDGRGRMRALGVDYLGYALVDSVVDHYFPVIEKLDDRLIALEEEISQDAREDTMRSLFALKREILTASKLVRPVRDALRDFLKKRPELVREETFLFFQDAADHASRFADQAEGQRELANGAIDLYHSTVSHRMNEVMKVLTLFTSVFMPMTFIAGLYGMNFSSEVSPWNMPELATRYGYPVVLVIMFGLGLAMMIWFWRKGWIGNR